MIFIAVKNLEQKRHIESGTVAHVLQKPVPTVERVSLIAGMEYGMERWNGKWNGTMNVHIHS